MVEEGRGDKAIEEGERDVVEANPPPQKKNNPPPMAPKSPEPARQR